MFVENIVENRVENDTWWWNEVQAAVKDKRPALQQMKENENDTTKESYREVVRKAKRVEAIAKKMHTD